MVDELRHTGIMERPYIELRYPSSADADVAKASGQQSMATTMDGQRLVMGTLSGVLESLTG
jgi:hypothetical protein